MAQPARERILLVDDEPQVLVALEDLLSDHYVVFKSESALNALELMESEPDIAVVVTDQRMPKMSGEDFLATLGNECQAVRILVTGYADLSAVTRAVNDGKLFAYVTKPWDADDLLFKVDRAAHQFRLEQELERERQLLHHLMDNIPDAIFFKDHDLRFLHANQPYADLIGISDPNDLITRRSSEVLADPRVSDESEERNVLATQQPIIDAIREISLPNARRWYSETKAPIRAPGKPPLGVVGISRDITARMEAQAALREQDAKLREQAEILNGILDGMNDGVVVAALDGRFLHFNRRARQILGKGALSVAPNGWAGAYGLFRADAGTPLSLEENPLGRALRGEAIAESEIFVKQGSNGFRVVMTATPLKNARGELAGGIALLRDVTEQRQLEQQLLQAQKMEAIGQLAGGIAHDFNNLLAVIASYGELVLSDLAPEDPRRGDVGEILSASNRAAALTRQLLAFSRREVVQPRVISLNGIIANAERMLKRIIGEDIELVTQLLPELWRTKIDPGHVEQIILNLTVNARDAMPNGGTLEIVTENLTLEGGAAAVPDGRYCLLRISDTGMGMDPETRTRIFEPFFTTKEVGKGTGLGLSTVFGIVQQAAAHVEVDSELNQGTTFRFYFPMVEDELDASSRTRQPTPRTQASGTILLLEDEDAVRQVALRILEREGFTVHAARRAEEALTLFKDLGAQVDLLLTDVVLPGASGPEFAEQLRALKPDLKVVYMSGHTGEQPGHRIPLGGDDVGFIQKPFTPDSLVATVRGKLGQ